MHACRPRAKQRSGVRRIILSTPIAESSITLDGVTIVVDSGYRRSPAYDVNTGINRLRTVFISAASAEQRRGRAGRTGPGECVVASGGTGAAVAWLLCGVMCWTVRKWLLKGGADCHQMCRQYNCG